MTRNRKILGLGAALAIVLAMSVTQLTAGATDPPSAGPTIDAGQLRLHMSSDSNAFAYVDAGGSTVATQPITQKKKCTYSSVPDLMAVMSTGGTPGFTTSNEQIGVDSNDGASKCTQENPGETLTLDLTNGSGTKMDGLYATHAKLDVELKFNPIVTISAYKDGGSAAVWTENYDCSASDCGPDRDVAGDNQWISFPKSGTVLFDSLKIEVNPSGTAGFSLEGGNDLYPGGITHDSIFYMAQPAEGTICQGDTIHEPTQDGGMANVTWQGTPDGTKCKDYNLTYTRDSSTNQRDLTFITGTGPTATFDVQMFSWGPEAAVNPVPPTQVEPPTPAHDGKWCDGTPSAPTMPSGESWCLLSQSSTIAGSDDGSITGTAGTQLMQVKEEWMLTGDARIGRG